MFSPSRMTLPSARAPGSSSWRRLRQRTSVDLPDPEGPISAVTWLGSTDSEMSSIASRLPYQAERLEISKLAAMSDAPFRGHEPSHQGKGEHQSDQRQRRRPRPLDLCRKRRLGAGEDLQWQGRHRLGELEGDVLAAECGEQEWGRL